MKMYLGEKKIMFNNVVERDNSYQTIKIKWSFNYTNNFDKKKYVVLFSHAYIRQPKSN